MGTFRYTKTLFHAPLHVTEAQYNDYKSELRSNPSSNLMSEEDSFTWHFSGYFIWFGKLLVGGLLLMFLGVALEDTFIMPVFFGSGALLFFGSFLILFQVFMEAPSFAKAIRTKRNFMHRVIRSIKCTNSYGEFLDDFSA